MKNYSLTQQDIGLSINDITLNALIIDHPNEQVLDLQKKLEKLCSQILLKKICWKKEEILTQLMSPEFEIIFFNPVFASPTLLDLLPQLSKEKAVICISNNYDFLKCASFWESTGYLAKPIQEESLLLAIKAACTKLIKSRNNSLLTKMMQYFKSQKKENRLLGIPTIEGYEIIAIDSLIRCEGLQKCTRIITNDKTNIVSSYNIGMFKKLLSRFPEFMTVHRSHVINLRFARKYKKSGSIELSDKSKVPVAQRHRETLLAQITHL